MFVCGGRDRHYSCSGECALEEKTHTRTGIGKYIFLILTQCGECVLSPLNGVLPHNHTQLASVRETVTQEMEEKRERGHCSKENRVTTPNHQIPRREMEKEVLLGGHY